MKSKIKNAAIVIAVMAMMFFMSFVCCSLLFSEDYRSEEGTKIYDNKYELQGTTKGSWNTINVYDTKYNLMYRVQDGKIYDTKFNQIGTIQKQGKGKGGVK